MKWPQYVSDLNASQYAELLTEAARAERLNALLLDEQNKNAQLRADLRTFNETRAEVVQRWTEEVDQLKEEVRVHAENALRDRNRLTLVAQHLPMFVTEWLSLFTPFKEECLTDEIREAKKAALELLTLLEPFAP